MFVKEIPAKFDKNRRMLFSQGLLIFLQEAFTIFLYAIPS